MLTGLIEGIYLTHSALPLTWHTKQDVFSRAPKRDQWRGSSGPCLALDK